MSTNNVTIGFCAFCGAQLSQEQRYCIVCGNNVVERNCRCEGTFDPVDGMRMTVLRDGERDEPTER